MTRKMRTKEPEETRAVGSFQRFFIAAGSFDAIAATDGIIRPMPESLRMVGIGDFPADQNYACSKEKTPAKKTFDEQHGSKDHEMSPVKDPAVDTAAIFHDPGLEGAEEHDTDDIGKVIEKGHQHHLSLSNHSHEVECSDRRIQAEPEKHDLPGFHVHVLHVDVKFFCVVRFVWFYVGIRSAFSEAHGDSGKRQQMLDHPHDEDRPDHMLPSRLSKELFHHQRSQSLFPGEIQKQNNEKHGSTKAKSEEVLPIDALVSFIHGTAPALDH